MFNIGFSEMILIAVLALVFIGPKQLPEIARTVGRFLNEMKRASSSLTGDFNEQFNYKKLIEPDEEPKIDRYAHLTPEERARHLNEKKTEDENS